MVQETESKQRVIIVSLDGGNSTPVYFSTTLIPRIVLDFTKLSHFSPQNFQLCFTSILYLLSRQPIEDAKLTVTSLVSLSDNFSEVIRYNEISELFTTK